MRSQRETPRRIDGALTDYWSLSAALRHVGDRWSLLIVRELLAGARGFNELSRALPDISRTLLSQRLKRLGSLGIVQKTNSSSYALTERGYSLSRVLEEIGLWANRWYEPFEYDVQTGVGTLLDHMSKSIIHHALPQSQLLIHFEFAAWAKEGMEWGIIYEGGKARSHLGLPVRLPDLEVHVAPRVLYELWWGLRSCYEARQIGDIGFVGPDGWEEQFTQWFTPASPES